MKLLAQGAELTCTKGDKTSSLTVSSTNLSFVHDASLATWRDFNSMTNIKPFGKCSAARNPDVIKANGVPQPCIPATPTPWSDTDPTIEIDGLAVLTEASSCACIWGGTIRPKTPGQDLVEIVPLSKAKSDADAPQSFDSFLAKQRRRFKRPPKERPPEPDAETFLYKLRLHDQRRKPCASIAYRIELSTGETVGGTTDPQGVICQRLPKRLHMIRVTYTPQNSHTELVREAIVVPETTTDDDHFAHLFNMGFGGQRDHAVLHFQAAHSDLTPTGTLDDKTKAAISSTVRGDLESQLRG